MSLFVQFLLYVSFHIENPLCQTVLPADEQNRFALHCAAHTCYTQYIKLDCKVYPLQKGSIIFCLSKCKPVSLPSDFHKTWEGYMQGSN